VAHNGNVITINKGEIINRSGENMIENRKGMTLIMIGKAHMHVNGMIGIDGIMIMEMMNSVNFYLAH